MEAKQEVLRFVDAHGPVDAATVADCLRYETVGGAGATLLRLHRHGHLHRARDDGGYLYSLSPKGRQWLAWYSRNGGSELEGDETEEYPSS